MASIEELQNLKSEMFKKRREQAIQQTGAQQQEASDALTRRFASMGGRGSGAEIASQLKVREQGAQAQRQALQDVGEQELASKQQDIATQLQLQEAEKQRGFQTTEAEKQRGFQEKMAGQDLAQKKEIFDFERTQKMREMDMAAQQMELDKATTEFNKNLALHIQGIKGFGDTATILEQQNKAYQETLAQLKRDFQAQQQKENPIAYAKSQQDPYANQFSNYSSYV